MGSNRSIRSRKRKFCGNQYSKSKADATVLPKCESTASSKKLLLPNENTTKPSKESLYGYRLISMEILLSIFSVLNCPQCFNLSLNLVEDSRFGLSSNMSLICTNCSFVKAFCTSKKINKCNEVNTRFVFALRIIGKGFSAARKLCAMMNLPPFLSKNAFRHQEKKIQNAASSVAQCSMNTAAQDIRVMNKSENDVTNCAVSVDGTWQRRGYSSLNGCVSVISVVLGKILDLEVMSQYCRICKKLSTSAKHKCSNHNGSSAKMEPVGVYRIFERSISIRNLRYTTYYGDGDCKAYQTVKDIYGINSVD